MARPLHGSAWTVWRAGLPSDDQCTTNTYADNPGLNIYTRISRKETVAVACGETPNPATQVLGDERTYYDGLPTLGAAPTVGNPTKTERLAAHNGTTATYTVTGQSTFDTYGRPLAVKDAKGTTHTYTYTDTNGRATKMVSTGPLGNVTTELSPVWGHKTGDIDLNNKRTDLLYDKLGRLTEIRLPERPNSTTSTLKYTYLPFEQAAEGAAGIRGGSFEVVKVRGLNSPPGDAHGNPASPCSTVCQPRLDNQGISY